MNEMFRGRPVAGFPISFEWQNNEWLQLFDAQVELIREDIERERADDRAIIYLSCPISRRGGGHAATNVEIARFTQHRLATELGGRFWILNPTQYQLESKQGVGRIYRHAQALGLARETVEALPPPGGGDYMRMWTRVLVEAGGHNLGDRFDAYYFIGPRDVQQFFAQGGATSRTFGIESYFALKLSTDPDFRDEYSPADSSWEELRKDFIRFYSLRASATYSLGCHDEWNILTRLNRCRLERRGVGSQIAAFFDGRQVTPSAAERSVSPGYAIEPEPAAD